MCTNVPVPGLPELHWLHIRSHIRIGPILHSSTLKGAHQRCHGTDDGREVHLMVLGSCRLPQPFLWSSRLKITPNLYTSVCRPMEEQVYAQNRTNNKANAAHMFQKCLTTPCHPLQLKRREKSKQPSVNKCLLVPRLWNSHTVAWMILA